MSTNSHTHTGSSPVTSATASPNAAGQFDGQSTADAAASNTNAQPSGNEVLRLTDVSLSVPDGQKKRQLIKNANLTAHAGEFIGIVGRSGSGKSTLLALAGGLQQPDSGTIEIFSRENKVVKVSGSSPAQAATIRRNNIGFIFQSPRLIPALNAREQLLVMEHLGAKHKDESGKSAKERADELLAAVGLEGMEKRKPDQLSGGQQARVGIARALMVKPEILLVDEPTAALDAESAAAVTELIQKVTRDIGCATLYVTHDADQLSKADRIMEVVDGAPREADRDSVLV